MNLIGKLSLYIRANFFIPDARKGWNNYAIKAAEEIIKRTKIDAVMTSSPPHSTQLIGLHLKQKFGIRWVADLRDPWTDIYYYNKLHHSRRAKIKDADYELSVLKSADYVVATSQSTASKFASKLSFQKDKIRVITNGYDPEDFTGIKAKQHDKFTITFVGTIGLQFGINGLVEALMNLRDHNPNLPFRIQFVGKMDAETREFLTSKISSHTEIVGYVSHKESLIYTCSADLLLLVIPKGENQGTVPGKTFEYLATRRPILCLAPNGSSAGNIIEQCDGGAVFGHDDVNGITTFLQELITKRLQGMDTQTKSDNFTMFSRENLTENLVKLLVDA
jgi:glycosyltransferase involved in cell wall biosynthesis